MVTVLAGIRYALFALYIICSGVLVTAAAWHLGLASTIGASAQLDSYVVFLGAFGLLFILAVAFIDALRKYAVTSTAWFELSWVGLFWVFYLAAAAASTAIGPGMFCNTATSNVLGWKDACAAIKVIMAFTWIGTVLFLVHLFTLLALSLLHAPQSPGVWHSGVRDFPWLDFATRPSFRNSVSANGGIRMGSEPNSPAKYHYARRMTAQPGAAPVSMQPAVTAPIHARMTSRVPYPSHTPEHYPAHHPAHPYAAAAVPRPAPAHDLESSQPHQYKPARDPHARTPSQAIIEQFRAGQGSSNRGNRKPVPGQVQSTIVRALPRLPSEAEVASPRPRRANPGLTEGQITGASQPVRKPSEPLTVSSFQSNQPQSLYPMHVQATMESAPPSTVSHEHEPQPLGQWPRRNPPADPRRERNAAPPAFRAIPATIPSAGPMTAAGARERVARRTNTADSDSSVDSDGVPRRRDGRPKHRPPPLDFSRLNAGRQ